MFEGLTLAAQRQFEDKRGWKPHYSASTYCTAETVIMQHLDRRNEDVEVLIATRTSGAPDCVGKIQSKWGGYVKPIDQTPKHSMARTLKETFEWQVNPNALQLAGIIGPWLYKSTLMMKGGEILLDVTDVQAEKTPFQAVLFAGIVSDNYELGHGGYLQSTKDAAWVTLGELVEREGNNPDHVYWSMMFACLRAVRLPSSVHANSVIIHHVPGRHSFTSDPA